MVQEQKEALGAKSRVVESQQKALNEQPKTITKISEKLDRLERVLRLKRSLDSIVDSVVWVAREKAGQEVTLTERRRDGGWR